MNEPTPYKKDTDAPEIQDIIMSHHIGIISAAIAERLHIPPMQALMDFYESNTCRQLHNKRTGLYLMSNLYLADEYYIEKGYL